MKTKNLRESRLLHNYIKQIIDKIMKKLLMSPLVKVTVFRIAPKRAYTLLYSMEKHNLLLSKTRQFIKARTEFGAKIGAGIVEGYTFIDHHSWDTYNESQDLLLQIQLFKERFGYLPSTILAAKIYLNRANRDILEDFEIHSYCKPLGRPPKDPPSDEMKSRVAKAIGERNEIECSFGTGKRIYRANDIRAKLPNTARCWTGMCYFVKNVMKFLRELCLALTELWRFFINFVTMRGHICYSLSVAGN